MVSNEFFDLFYRKLDLQTMEQDVQTNFLASITRYIDRGMKNMTNGRTLNFVSLKLDNLIELLECMGLNKVEIVKVLTNFPGILNNVDDLYYKYLFLGILENEENTLRKEKLVNKTKDFIVGLPKMYARYCLIRESGYNKATWYTIVHSSDQAFASVFVRGTYQKPYKVFNNINQVLDWLKSVNLEDFDVEYFKSLSVNEELVKLYEKREQSPRKN